VRDLEDWLFTLYVRSSRPQRKGHRAAGMFTTGGVRGIVNVESMRGTVMVQH